MLTNEQVKEFKENGVLVLKDFYNYEKDIKPIQKDIYKIIGELAKKYNFTDIVREKFNGNNFDTKFYDMVKKDRKFCSDIYDAVKQIPSFIRLLSKMEHEELAKVLFNSSLCGVVGRGYGMRIDLPNDKEFKGAWHQEYPYQLRSLKGIVLWTPLIEILQSLGPVEFCIGSQEEGILPLYEDKFSSGSAAYSWRLQNEEVIIEKYRKIAPLTKPTDLVIIDWLVLHQSGINISENRARWTMQMRYFDFEDNSGRDLSWIGSYHNGISFKEIHPKLFKEGK